jgi:repressor LexA
LTNGGIPLIGTISAGRTAEAVENWEGDLAISPDLFGCENSFGLRDRGDSMIEARIMDGDRAIIRPQPKVENGEIAAVLVQDVLPEATLKIIRRTRSNLSLEPANSSYPALDWGSSLLLTHSLYQKESRGDLTPLYGWLALGSNP